MSDDEKRPPGPPPKSLAEFWQQDRKAFLDYWHRCEDVAVHFNDLNARFRLQALAGLALAGTLLGAFKAGTGVSDTAVAGVLFGLFVVWVAVAWIDGWYYGRLLRGAVVEIVKIEQATQGVLTMSTEIERACKFSWTVKGRKLADDWRTSRVGRAGFYVGPASTLLVAAILVLVL